MLSYTAQNKINRRSGLYLESMQDSVKIKHILITSNLGCALYKIFHSVTVNTCALQKEKGKKKGQQLISDILDELGYRDKI
jgi:hypothetical protein